MGDVIVEEANGRYGDRIKVYYNNAWHTINRLRVYSNGNWIDLGTNDSNATQQLYAVNGTASPIRITRDRVDTPKTETIGLGYHQGEWSISTRQQYCFNTTAPGVTKTKFYAFFKVKASGASKLFSFSSSYFWNTFFESGIRDNGKVWYRVCDSGGKTWWNDTPSWTPNDNTHETTEAIQMGFDKGWQTIEFTGDIGSNTLYVKVNGVSQGFARHTAWETSSTNEKVGSDNLRVATDGTFKIDTANSPFTTISEDKTTRSYTETTWV